MPVWEIFFHSRFLLSGIIPLPLNLFFPVFGMRSELLEFSFSAGSCQPELSHRGEAASIWEVNGTTGSASSRVPNRKSCCLWGLAAWKEARLTTSPPPFHPPVLRAYHLCKASALFLSRTAIKPGSKPRQSPHYFWPVPTYTSPVKGHTAC